MILNIVLFLTCGVLVTSNNGYPIIPAQTYPNCQQNGYANPPANQPNDIASYLQAMLVQNQSPSLNLSPSDVKQILLNELLSGHQMQTNSDQNSRGYVSNCVEMPYNAMSLNGANSYFAPSMANEYKNNQRISANKENKKEEIKTEEKQKKTKKRKSKRKHNESIKRRKSELDKEDDVRDNNKQFSKKSRKRSHKPKTEASSHENQSNNEQNKKNKKKIRKNKVSEVKNPVEGNDMVEEPKPQRHHKKKKKSNKDNEEILVSDLPKTLKSTHIQEGINLAHFNEGIVEENRIPRNPVPESNDLFKSIPNLPENFANNFNFNSLSQFNNPAMSHFFSNYENIYQTMMANNKGTSEQREIKKSKIPQNSRNNNRTKLAVKNKNSTATTVPKRSKPAVIPKVKVVTTEKTVHNKEKNRVNNDPIPKDEGPKSIEKPSEKKDTMHELENGEVKDMLETNINDPDSNYGYIEDYYPQFTDSAAYTASNREVYIKNLSDTKYYYAVDKENPELINRRRFEALVLPERIVKDYKVKKNFDDAEENIKTIIKPGLKGKQEDVIQFRTPPQLEIPDFQTRKVHRSEINPGSNFLFDEIDDYDARFLPDKASIYSEVKIPHQRGTKDGDEKVIETVFARSKVATYGPVYIPENSISSTTSNEELTDGSHLIFKDGGTTFVLAKTLDYQ